MNADPNIIARAEQWLSPDFDEETRKQVRYLMEHDTAELTESFYTDLEFGTGGLRGIMGTGTNRMNKYTVGMATQGLANYLHKAFPGTVPSVAIAFDSRNNSSYFAQVAAAVLSANACRVFIFGELRPTPVLSFAVRHLECNAGIVITASHNPKEYNGYKVYWNDGGQLVPPHDANVIAEVRAIASPAGVRFNANPALIEVISPETDRAYLNRVKNLSLLPDVIQRQHDLKIVYTPLHGAGITMVPAALGIFGFSNISVVQSQAVPDGNFSTLQSPNPEEPAALSLAIAQAEKSGAEIVMATDPDADRVGIAVRNSRGQFILLNGNQTASLLIAYLCMRWKEQGWLTGREYIVKTIVTSELLKEIASGYGVKCFDVLTGFKYIAEIINRLGNTMKFIAGGEESYGYLVDSFVRDKDAVISCCMIAEMAAWVRDRGSSLYEWLIDLYREYGLFYESLLSVTKKGKAGAEEIAALMEKFRKHPPLVTGGSNVVKIIDYRSRTSTVLPGGEISPVDLPVSDVLQFFTADGSKITIRPSGTEPKIKFYFGIKTSLGQDVSYSQAEAQCREKIDRIVSDLGL